MVDADEDVRHRSRLLLFRKMWRREKRGKTREGMRSLPGEALVHEVSGWRTCFRKTCGRWWMLSGHKKVRQVSATFSSSNPLLILKKKPSNGCTFHPLYLHVQGAHPNHSIHRTRTTCSLPVLIKILAVTVPSLFVSLPVSSCLALSLSLISLVWLSSSSHAPHVPAYVTGSDMFLPSPSLLSRISSKAGVFIPQMPQRIVNDVSSTALL